MVYRTLSCFAEGLSEYLSRVFSLRDDMVLLSAPENRSGTAPNKLLVTLVNVERETAGGITFVHRSSGERLTKSSPPWQINLYVLVTAFFAEKQYGEGLRILSESLNYIQNHSVMNVPPSNDTLTIEPVNLSFTELSNLWSICGGAYQPSILCKIRLLELSADELRSTSIPITEKQTGV